MTDTTHRLLLEPKDCICPNPSYTCQADSILRMEWRGDVFPDDDIKYSLLDRDDKSKTEIEIGRDGVFQVKFIRSMVVEGFTNISSTVSVTNLTELNGTNITCISTGVDEMFNDTLTVCIIGEREISPHCMQV